jgi:triacylglycerol esterase/lipase EstA (alpha/beta hydrolase family)
VVLREAVALARQSILIPKGASGLRETGPAPHLTVFVHGYMASGGVFTPLARYLADIGVAPRQLHFSYKPLGSVAGHALRLAAMIRDAQPEGAVDIVGHSMGGLLARYYRQILGRRLDRLVCLATPHRGTRVAAGFGALPLARELAPGSETLRLLETTRGGLAGVRVCSVVAESDAMVTPLDNAALEGHEAVRLHGVGHQGILFDRGAWSHVRRVLSEPRLPARVEVRDAHGAAA